MNSSCGLYPHNAGLKPRSRTCVVPTGFGTDLPSTQLFACVPCWAKILRPCEALSYASAEFVSHTINSAKPQLHLRGVVRAVHVDAGDLHGGVRLAMSIQLLVLLLALEVEDQNLVAAALLDDLSGDKRIRRLADLALGGADGQHFVELHVLAASLRQLLDLNYVSGRDAILLSPGADHRVHGNASNSYIRAPQRFALACGARDSGASSASPAAQTALNSLCACTSPSRKETFAERRGVPDGTS